LDTYLVTHPMAEQGATEWTVLRDAPPHGVGFVGTDDAPLLYE
jgi:hypothetical protein